MSVVGRVESLWRYPVKSMRGEELTSLFLGKGGVVGDRIYAFHYSAAAADFPYWTARQRAEMLLYRASYREGEVLVETPAGEKLSIEDRGLAAAVSNGMRAGESTWLVSSERSMSDAYPVSLLSIQTVEQLGVEVGIAMDKMRFRANVYVNLDHKRGFAEDEFVGRKLQIGEDAVVEVMERDVRCKMITLDPKTAEANPNVMRQVAQLHDRKVGVYASVAAEGTVRVGDELLLLA